jgi:peroxiredoxin
MRIAAVFAFLAMLAIPALAVRPNVGKPTKEFTITEPSGKQILLTGLKGKVVYIQFLATTCPHCQALSRVLTKTQEDLGSKGLQVIGVAFNEADAAKAAVYKKEFNVGFPVGYASRESVLSYLGISVMERFAVPQVVMIDRKGIIRQQSEPMGSSELQNDANVRKLLGEMLAEGAGAAKSAPKTVSSTKK